MPPLDPDAAREFLADRHWGVLATLKGDGRPQLSNIGYAVLDGRVRVSVTDSRAKVANIQRDARVSLHVTSDDFWTYVVAEGAASLTDVSREPGDEVGRRLLALYEAISGPHPDPDEFLRAMVDEGRLELSFSVEHLYPVSKAP
jgi:PPOX class probable F420-dependent enzyme